MLIALAITILLSFAIVEWLRAGWNAARHLAEAEQPLLAWFVAISTVSSLVGGFPMALRAWAWVISLARTWGGGA